MPNVDELLQGARDAIAAKRVYADPVERDGVTVVPAASVRGGGGGGGDNENNGGAGFGLAARPVGAYVIGPGERVEFVHDRGQSVLLESRPVDRRLGGLDRRQPFLIHQLHGQLQLRAERRPVARAMPARSFRRTYSRASSGKAITPQAGWRASSPSTTQTCP